MKNIIITLGLLGFLTACGGTKQDPDLTGMKKDDGNVNKPTELTGREALEIDSDAYYKFSEGEEAEIKVFARSMYKKSKFVLELSNPQDFPNAKITAEEGDEAQDKKAVLTINWKVPTGLKFTDGINQKRLALVARTVGYAALKNLNEEPEVSKDVLVMLASTSKIIPLVTKVGTLAAPIKEGTGKGTLQVFVTDASGTAPTLVILPNTKNTYGINGASYLTFGTAKPDPATANGYVFDVTVDLTNVEITQGTGTAYFDVAAFSPSSGSLSAAMTGNFTVWTSISKPVTTWTADVNFKSGIPNNYTFTITDPKAEGMIGVTFNTNCSAIGATCSCKSITNIAGKKDGTAQCTISWTPGANLVGQQQEINVSMSNKSAIPGDTEVQTAQLSGKININ